MAEQKPTIGRIVHYALSPTEAAQINNLRVRDDNPYVGNYANPGDVYPMLITRVWGEFPGGAVNGQVLLDGNDSLWVTSVCEGEGERTFNWPKAAPAPAPVPASCYCCNVIG